MTWEEEEDEEGEGDSDSGSGEDLQRVETGTRINSVSASDISHKCYTAHVQCTCIILCA